MADALTVSGTISALLSNYHLDGECETIREPYDLGSWQPPAARNTLRFLSRAAASR
jgi:hypothetical protein